MSLARAFTTKRAKRPEISAPLPQRSMSTKQFAAGTINRGKISAPVELISTTNMLSYNAPDLYPSSASSLSGDDSDINNKSFLSSPLTSPDSSSIESGPCSPEPNHLTSYFNKTRTSTSSNEQDGPSIPQRAPSHTKKTHENMARKRSISRMSSPKNSISTARGSLAMFSNPGEAIEAAKPYSAHTSQTSHTSHVSHAPHPFGNELAQVSELAEEFGGNVHIVDEEERELVSLGLLKFGAEDYMNEIHGLFTSAFGEVRSHKPATAMWI